MNTASDGLTPRLGRRFEWSGKVKYLGIIAAFVFSFTLTVTGQGSSASRVDEPNDTAAWGNRFSSKADRFTALMPKNTSVKSDSAVRSNGWPTNTYQAETDNELFMIVVFNVERELKSARTQQEKKATSEKIYKGALSVLPSFVPENLTLARFGATSVGTEAGELYTISVGTEPVGRLKVTMKSDRLYLFFAASRDGDRDNQALNRFFDSLSLN